MSSDGSSDSSALGEFFGLDETTADNLQAFATRPEDTVWGIILGRIVAVVLSATAFVLTGITYVFGFPTRWGDIYSVADVPATMADVFGMAVDGIVLPLTDAMQRLNEGAAMAVAGDNALVAPLVVFAFWALETVILVGGLALLVRLGLRRVGL